MAGWAACWLRAAAAMIQRVLAGRRLPRKTAGCCLPAPSVVAPVYVDVDGALRPRRRWAQAGALTRRVAQRLRAALPSSSMRGTERLALGILLAADATVQDLNRSVVT